MSDAKLVKLINRYGNLREAYFESSTENVSWDKISKAMQAITDYVEDHHKDILDIIQERADKWIKHTLPKEVKIAENDIKQDATKRIKSVIADYKTAFENAHIYSEAMLLSGRANDVEALMRILEDKRKDLFDLVEK